MSQLCSRCNAPLALGPAGAIAKCAYCGTETRVAGQSHAGINVISDPALRARLNKEIADRSAEEDARKAAEQTFARKAGLAFVILVILLIACRAWLSS